MGGPISSLQWSILGLVNLADGALAEQYAYNVFGERVILDANEGFRTESAFDNEYGYTSRRHDGETGLMRWCRFRGPVGFLV